MAKKSFFKNCLLFVLTLLCAICVCSFFVACSSDDESADEESVSYSYTEEDTENISNALFSYGTTGKTEGDFPLTSPTGWSRTTDNSAATSGVTSGVINIEKWDAIFDTFYSNNTFSKFCQNQFPTEYKDGDNDIPAETSKASIKSKFAPTKYSDGADNYMFMLNNYSTNYEGTAQKLTSSSTVSVKKGEIYKISVWVKAMIFDAFETGTGANIRITPTVDGNSQADFQINNITNNAWKQYTVYFVADDDYDCSFKITLGLGYGNGKQEDMSGYVEGTVFFDDVTVEKVDALPNDVSFDEDVNQKTLAYGTEDVYALSGAATYNFAFKATFTDAFFTDIDNSEKTFIVDNEDDEVTKVVIKNGSSDFVITTLNEDDYEKYVIVSFKLLNKLNKLGSTDVSVNVIESYHDDTLDRDYEETRKAVATFSEVSDDYTDCYILIKNNFKNQTRKFRLEIVIGPETLSQYVNDNADGMVKIKDIKFTSGYISSEQYANKEKDVDYKLYSFYSAKANSTTALYAGYEDDYSEHNHSSSFSLTTASGTTGKIINDPTAVNGYNGITFEHVYVKEDSDVYTINDRLSFANEKGYAGLINTKYIANYPEALKTELAGLYDTDNDIQPLVIYNKVADSYGFIGSQQTVSASDYAKVTVKLKVSGDAKAYIYLVDTSNKTKQVLTFADFTVNTEFGIANASIKDKSYTAEDHKFMLVIDKNSPVGTDGFVEANLYLATGADAKNFRVEIWNGDRTGANKSQGYVIVNSIDVSTSSAFTEPATWQAAFDDESSPFYNKDFSELIAYTRKLTDTEKQFNAEYPDDAVSYKPTYVWAKGETVIYGIFNTVNPVENNPYDSIEQEDEESGCAADSDPSTFWLSFSSIVLAAVLVLAIIALFVKNLRAKRKSTRSDVKAQYKVKSRTETQKAIRQAKEKQAAKKTEPEVTEETETETSSEETADNTVENSEDVSETNGDETEQTGYVYGDVQDFGDMTLEMPEEKAEEVKPDETETENKDE